VAGIRWHLILISGAALAACASQGTSDDEPLDPRAAAFYAAPAAAPAAASGGDDAAVGLLGLNAPRGRDFMEYGRGVATRHREGDFRKTVAQDSLEIIWNPERMFCWVFDYEPFDRDANCAPIEEAVTTLSDNAELLERYRKILSLPPPDGSVFYPGALFISMTKLTAVSMKVDWQQGRPEKAYREWAEQHMFVQRMCSATSGVVELAICLVNEGISLGAIEALLFHAPQLADAHSAELIRVLTPSSITRYNIPRVMRVRFSIFKESPEAAANTDMLLPNYIANRYYLYAQEVIDSMLGSATELAESDHKECKCLSTFDPNSKDPRIAVSSKLLALMVSPMPTFIARSMHGKNRMMAMLTIGIRIVTERVPDAEVPAFIEANAGRMGDALAGARIVWNPARRVLSFDDAKNFGPMEVRL
jgi:hypothetical protein